MSIYTKEKEKCFDLMQIFFYFINIITIYIIIINEKLKQLNKKFAY
jgi:hypothetical protein